MIFVVWTVFLLTRLSVLVLYKRIMLRSGATNMVLNLLLLGTCGQYLYGLFINLLNCSPITAMYNVTIKPAKCLPAGVAWSAIALHVALDFALVTVPFPMVLRLHLSMRERLILLMLFSFGYL